jgi:hypothetical protein
MPRKPPPSWRTTLEVPLPMNSVELLGWLEDKKVPDMAEWSIEHTYGFDDLRLEVSWDETSDGVVVPRCRCDAPMGRHRSYCPAGVRETRTVADA